MHIHRYIYAYLLCSLCFFFICRYAFRTLIVLAFDFSIYKFKSNC